MQVQRQSDGQCLLLEAGAILGTGGEARLYRLPTERSLAAKVYHTPTAQQARKLMVMLANPPDDPMRRHGHTSIAWPVDLLWTTNGQRHLVGFLMPQVMGMRSIMAYYNPLSRRQHCPLFNYRYLHRTAYNLAATVRAVHARGYVIGDMNEANVLVSDTALVTLVDTDSFQVRDPRQGTVYRCAVGKAEFTPPEMQGQVFAHIDRAPEHDLFGLAVLIFQLLMEGTHPFAGVYQGPGEPPPYEARIAAGHFPYSTKRRTPYRPMPAAPPLAVLHPALRALFRRCFEDGHARPALRPDAQAWQQALSAAEKALISCDVNAQHLYGTHLQACPWCARTTRLEGRDPFPSRQSVQQRHRGQFAFPPLQGLSGIGSPGQSGSSRPQRPAAAGAQAAQARPTLLMSVCSGMLWGSLCGALLGLLVYMLVAPQADFALLPSVTPAMIQRAGWGAIWGMVWGMLWGLCQRPVSVLFPLSPLGRLLMGAILGALLGIVTSGIVDGVPGSVGSVQQWRPPMLPLPQWPIVQGQLSGVVVILQEHAIPGGVVGILLGSIWGAWRR